MDSWKDKDKENILPSSLKTRTGLVFKTKHSYAPQPNRKFGKELFVDKIIGSSQCTRDDAIALHVPSDLNLKTAAESEKFNKVNKNEHSIFPNEIYAENKITKMSSIPNYIGRDDDDLPQSPELSSEFALKFSKNLSVNKINADSKSNSVLKTTSIANDFHQVDAMHPYTSFQDSGTYLYDWKNTTVPGSMNKSIEVLSNKPVSEIKRGLRHYQSTPDCKQGSHISESPSSSAFPGKVNGLLSRMKEFKIPVPFPRKPLLAGSTVKLCLDLDESEDDEQNELSEDYQDQSHFPEISEDQPLTTESVACKKITPQLCHNKQCIEHSHLLENHASRSINNKCPSHYSRIPNFSNKGAHVKENNENKREVGVGSPHIETKSQCVQTELSEKNIIVNGIFYTIVSQIGKGGSSKVYEGRCNKNGTTVAIKQVGLAKADKSVHDSFVNEIKLLKKLNGSNRVITMFDHEYHNKDGILNVVMEKGELDLQALIIDKHGKLKDYELQYYWMQMLEAVQVVHEAGIIHSDLKPANFVLVKGQLKLIDFGIASSIQSEDITSVMKDIIVGTYNYMSPEAINENDMKSVDDSVVHDNRRPCIKISRRSDVWSLGCILYALTYGKTPFEHIKKLLLKMTAITNPNYPIDYPPANKSIIAVIKRCLIHDPMKRSSINELLKHYFCAAPDTIINVET